MAEEEWIEIAVFIHGITPEESPEDQEENPNVVYDKLFRHIQKELKKNKKPLLDPKPIKVVWNWVPTGDISEYKDQGLAKAERQIGREVIKFEKEIWDFKHWYTIWHSLLWHAIYKRCRDALLYGFADGMYYVSQDGEKTVRDHVFKEVSEEIIKRLNEGGEKSKVSLTVIGHSAGSLIAHDFLYHLFSGRKQKPHDVQEIKDLRGMAEDTNKAAGDKNPLYSRLRVRRLYTFGSPLAPWILRANSLLTKITSNQPLKVADLGLGPRAGLPNPRWVNFWALTDVAAFPVSFLYDDPEAVEDRYINVGLWFPTTHGAYWGSSEMAEYIAHTF
jgi:hypothetical protein